MAQTRNKARTWSSRQPAFGPWWCWWAVFGWLLLSSPVAAGDAHVINRCPRLDDAQYEELDARVLLLLRAEGTPRSLPVVVCTAQDAWVEWEGTHHSIVGRALVEEVVELVESRLQRAPGSPAQVNDEAGSSRLVVERDGGAAPPPPRVSQPAQRTALRPSDARGGGIALGVETELGSHTIDAASGPAFDFAAIVGPLLIGGRESIRFTLSGRRVSFMDFQLLVGHGAPFDPSKRFGIALRTGPEWMVAYPEGNSGQAAVVPVAELGLRVAHHWGPLGIWLGLDAKVRFSRLVLRSRGELIANDVSGSLTLGAAFVDWSRK